jgi:hypothetical protein
MAIEMELTRAKIDTSRRDCAVGREAASRRVMAKPCGNLTNGVMHIVKVVGAGKTSQKNVEKSFTGRAQRDDRRASADCSARRNAIDTNKYVSITKLTRDKICC